MCHSNSANGSAEVSSAIQYLAKLWFSRANAQLSLLVLLCGGKPLAVCHSNSAEVSSATQNSSELPILFNTKAQIPYC
jgi:hypothetical protein